MLRARKSDIIEQIKLDLKTYPVAIACGFSSVRADKMSQIRKRLFDIDGKVMVTKHTLFKIAAEGSAFEPMIDKMPGESIAITYSNDSLGLIKLLSDIAKKDESWKLKFGFILPGQYLSEMDIKAIAQLPPLEVVRSRLIGTMQSVMQKILFITKEPMRKVAFLLQNKNNSHGG